MEFTVNQIAALVNGRVEGNGDAQICTFAKIEEGAVGALSFLANPKYTPYIYNTDSTAVLVREDFVAEEPVKATLIRVADPYVSVAHLLQLAQSMASKPMTGFEQPCHVDSASTLGEDVYVGAFAYVAKGAKIGNRVKIYPRAYVGEGVEIGDDTVLYPGATIYQGCRVGARCIIHAGAVIGADGFGFAPVGEGYEKIPQIGIVEISDDVEVGANTTIDRATMGATRIARGVKLDNLIQVGHNCTVEENTVIASQTGLAGSAHVGKHCILAGQVGVAGHNRVGDNVTIGAQCGVPNGVKDGMTVIGSPAMDARQWLRLQAYIKRLPELISDVSQLKKNK